MTKKTNPKIVVAGKEGSLHRYLKVKPSKKLTIPQLEKAVKAKSPTIAARAKTILGFTLERKNVKR
jgi:hypothetical protein